MNTDSDWVAGDMLTKEALSGSKFVNGTRSYAIDRWGHAAVRGVENLVVGRAYNYVYGGTKSRPDIHETVIVISVDAEDGTFSVVSPDIVRISAMHPSINYIREGSLSDAGVIPTENGKWNCNFMIPVGTEPNPAVPQQDFGR